MSALELAGQGRLGRGMSGALEVVGFSIGLDDALGPGASIGIAFEAAHEALTPASSRLGRLAIERKCLREGGMVRGVGHVELFGVVHIHGGLERGVGHVDLFGVVHILAGHDVKGGYMLSSSSPFLPGSRSESGTATVTLGDQGRW